jgi:hypothetical protein
MLIKKHHVEASPDDYCLGFTAKTRRGMSTKVKILQDDESPVLRGFKTNKGRLEVMRKDAIPLKPKKRSLLSRLWRGLRISRKRRKAVDEV